MMPTRSLKPGEFRVQIDLHLAPLASAILDLIEDCFQYLIALLVGHAFVTLQQCLCLGDQVGILSITFFQFL